MSEEREERWIGHLHRRWRRLNALCMARRDISRPGRSELDWQLCCCIARMRDRYAAGSEEYDDLELWAFLWVAWTGRDGFFEILAARVAPHKKIREVEFIGQIPKSISGKILRRVLIEQERTRQANGERSNPPIRENLLKL